MAREGLMDDTGYHGFDYECPEEINEEECSFCLYWDEKRKVCKVYEDDGK